MCAIHGQYKKIYIYNYTLDIVDYIYVYVGLVGTKQQRARYKKTNHYTE